MKPNIKLDSDQEVMLDEVTDGWWELNLETNSCNFSDKLRKKLGYDQAEKLLLANQLINAEDLQRIVHDFTLSTKSKSKFVQPIRYHHKDGQIIWSICKCKAIKNNIGKYEKLIGIHIDITALKESEKRLETLALYDSLTNLPNRLHFLESLNSAIARAKRHRTKLAVFFLDVDNLKYVNDNFGHDFGDHLLAQIAKLLIEGSRAVDFIARLGGDEFGIIIEDIHMKEAVPAIANRYIKAFEKIHRIKQKNITSTVSIGIAVFPKDGKSSEELLRNADKAMYKAKAEGKNNFVCFSTLT